MTFTRLQLRILAALVAHRDDKITDEQMAARLLIPYGSYRHELYHLRRLTKQRSTYKLTVWWAERQEWQKA